MKTQAAAGGAVSVWECDDFNLSFSLDDKCSPFGDCRVYNIRKVLLFKMLETVRSGNPHDLRCDDYADRSY
jgi:hypothetical protein